MKKLVDLLSGIDYSCDKDISDIRIDAVAHDSRKATYDTLFIAIVGAVSDGHRYAVDAYRQGCRVFLCEHTIELPKDAVLIICENTRRALALVSAAFFGYPAKKLHIIALTGTKGKTTTSYLIYSLLRAAGKPAAYIGSNGIDYGRFHYDTANTTPESYDLHYHFSKMVAEGISYVAMEVSSQALYLDRVFGIDFETVVFTNLAPDHIGGHEHPTFEHYKACKRKLFFDHNAQNMVYNADDPAAAEMINDSLSLFPVSTGTHKGVWADSIAAFCSDGVLGESFALHAGRCTYQTKTRAPGSFSVYNGMIAMVCAKLCGVNYAASAKLLPQLSVLGRFECVDIFRDRVFVIDYAHNGLSLRSVLEALAVYPHNRLICLFGSVGGRTEGRRRELGDVAAELCDLSILTSDNPDYESPDEIIEDIAVSFERVGNDRYVKIPNRTEAIRYAVEHSESGDIILLAGKGHETYQLVRGVKDPFSEKELLYRFAAECKEKENAMSVNI